ncbi:MFS transporter [Flavihumibacter profundi]|uniref:MFS transporter n=1 Tax=Flavihumibacter profundi TaxID=2716883 RepID=UPI001CC6EB02|nr:MFS transporter [Flavihumibacter profundi]MBZ5858406.1 MFS transporter [Flavihumibacter profundi]
MRKDKSANLPALTENTFLRYFNFVALYMAQGIPEGMTYFGIPAWLAMNGKSVAEIGGFVAIIGIPWSFKILVAPLMDRYAYLPMGRRRPWVLFGQLGLMCSFIGMAMVPDPLNNLHDLRIAGFFVGFFGAFQDVATDGMAIDIVPMDQQARANGLMWGSKIIGISASLALGSWLINHYNFSIALLSLSVAVSCIMLVPLLLRERPGEKLLPWTTGFASPETASLQLESWAMIFRSLLRVVLLPYSLLLIFPLYLMGLAFNFMNTLIPIFTVQVLHWTNQEYAQIYSLASLTGGIMGMFVGGALLDLFGKIRMLSIYYFLLILLTASMAFFKIYWNNSSFTTGYIFAYTVVYVFAMVGILAIAMQFCWKKVSATQFTLYMAISNLGYATGPALIGPLRQYFSWQSTILFFSIVVTIALFAIQFMRIKKHLQQVDALIIADKPEPELIVVTINTGVAENRPE